ncbi:MAG: hypothetical protein E7041_02180 [Lentisphaerae bacterium]|nr:hypothetical protein [Lentisphaerota bacterium]
MALNELFSNPKKRKLLLIIAAALIIGAVFTIWVSYAFKTNAGFKSLFMAADSQVIGETETGETLADKAEFTAKVSLWIFIFITLLQLIAFCICYAVMSTISASEDPVKLKLRSLENAEIFFDIPLYFGLFGTVSAFLVMTFSPQSSRLIAYSSTLIGILFSLFLRLALQYPLRKRLVRMDALEDKGADK